jgi:hypothetical protein
MRTSIFRIELALDGKVDFLKKTNPWGSGEDESDTPKGGKTAAPPMKDGQLDRDAVVDRMERAFAVFG